MPSHGIRRKKKTSPRVSDIGRVMDCFIRGSKRKRRGAPAQGRSYLLLNGLNQERNRKGACGHSAA